MEGEDLAGGCFCGAVRYRAGGRPFHLTSCHCLICRRTSAAPFVAWLSFHADDFRFTKGVPKTLESSAKGVRTFCADCGTPLTCMLRAFPGEIDVTLCSLDEPERFPPEDHTWTSRKLAWVRLADELPTHAETRPEASDGG